MKILKNAKRAAKFTFSTMPLSILGWKQFRANNRFIVDLWRTITVVRCPECHVGTLRHDDDAKPDSNAMYPWACTECGFTILAPDDMNAVREIALARSAERGKQKLAFIGDLEQARLIKGHLLKSRAFWFLAAMSFIWFAWRTATGAPLIHVLSALSLCLPFGIYAIRFSYRAWQVRTGTLSQSGAFQRYVRDFLWVRGV